MLLFAVFTLGYFFGVFITLKVFGRKDEVEGFQPAENALNSDSDRALSSWEIFTQLTKINHPKDSGEVSVDDSVSTDLITSGEPESRQKQAYATS